jgi:ABC-type branched-subunit amino acid transport system ATPase component
MLDERPIRSFDDDAIGFEPAVESLAELVRSADRHGELYGVFGPWGSGKTSFLKLLEAKVASSAKWIEFDALRHQATTDVLTALVAHVAREAVASGGGADVKRSFSRTAWALSLSVGDIALRSVTGLKLEDVKKHFETAEAHEVPESPADALRKHMEIVVKSILAATDRQTVVVPREDLPLHCLGPQGE